MFLLFVCFVSFAVLSQGLPNFEMHTAPSCVPCFARVRFPVLTEQKTGRMKTPLLFGEPYEETEQVKSVKVEGEVVTSLELVAALNGFVFLDFASEPRTELGSKGWKIHSWKKTVSEVGRNVNKHETGSYESAYLQTEWEYLFMKCLS